MMPEFPPFEATGYDNEMDPPDPSMGFGELAPLYCPTPNTETTNTMNQNQEIECDEEEDEDLYEIVRHYGPGFGRPAEVIRSDLTRTEAEEHCQDPDTEGDGWFDGFRKQ